MVSSGVSKGCAYPGALMSAIQDSVKKCNVDEYVKKEYCNECAMHIINDPFLVSVYFSRCEKV